MSNNLQRDPGHIFESGKTYTHAQGLSCCFRQWRASHSHCRFLHGYALQVTMTFRSKYLDDRNWVQDFGGLKEIKKWLEDTFDHKTLIAADDPQREVFEMFAGAYEPKIMDLIVVDHVGCEAFAKMIYDHVYKVLGDKIHTVEVREHEGNFARYGING